MMRTLPTTMLHLLNPFVPLFSRRVWPHVQVLLAGAILTPGKRTVSAALHVMGLGRTEHFQRYHRVLNRAVWSGREASRVLLGLLVKTFVPDGPLVIGVDETLERRWGKKIAAKGIYRDPVRSTHERFVKASGLRWVCLMLLVPVPWARRVWALPFLSILAPSERYAARRGKHHKKITDWARRALLLIRRWWPEREIVAVADSAYASLRLLANRRRFLPGPVTFITHLRLDAYASNGNRVQDIMVQNQENGDWEPLDLSATYSIAGYWSENNPNEVAGIKTSETSPPLTGEGGEPLDATEVVTNYLKSNAANPETGRIQLLEPLPEPAYGNPEIQPSQGVPTTH